MFPQICTDQLHSINLIQVHVGMGALIYLYLGVELLHFENRNLSLIPHPIPAKWDRISSNMPYFL